MKTLDHHHVYQSAGRAAPSRWLVGLPSQESTTAGYGKDEKKPSGPTDKRNYALHSVDTGAAFHHLNEMH